MPRARVGIKKPHKPGAHRASVYVVLTDQLDVTQFVWLFSSIEAAEQTR